MSKRVLVVLVNGDVAATYLIPPETLDHFVEPLREQIRATLDKHNAEVRANDRFATRIIVQLQLSVLNEETPKTSPSGYLILEPLAKDILDQVIQ